MPAARKKKAGKKAAEQATQPEIATKPPKKWIGYIIISSVVIIIIAIVIGVVYYQNYVAPFKKVIIQVDDISIDMDYFIRRAHASGIESMNLLTTITNEQIIILGAPRYGIQVSPEDIDEEFRAIARGESDFISESEFREWYRQQLNEGVFSDEEFRELIKIQLLSTRLHVYLSERMPTTAEHIHLYAIQLDSYSVATQAITRWENGEDFIELAREISLDETSRENGGDFGWYPAGALPDAWDYAAFNLEVGKISEPLQFMEGNYFLLFVSEKDASREVSAEYLPALQARVFDEWLLSERSFHEVDWTFNSEIAAWIGWQLERKTSQ